MSRFEVFLLVIAMAYLWKPFLWVVYRLCPLRPEHSSFAPEPRVSYDDVLYVWAEETWRHLYRVRQHENAAWAVYRQWANSIAGQRIARYRKERKNRVQRYVTNLLEKQARAAAHRTAPIPLRREAVGS